MLYSAYDEHNGSFNYYEARGPAINADHPTPSFGSSSPLGVASVEAARPLPASASYVGKGSFPKGAIATKSGGRAWSAITAVANGRDPSGLGAFENVDASRLALAVAVGLGVFLVSRNHINTSLPVSAVVSTGAAALTYGVSPIKALLVGVLPP